MFSDLNLKSIYFGKRNQFSMSLCMCSKEEMILCLQICSKDCHICFVTTSGKFPTLIEIIVFKCTIKMINNLFISNNLICGMCALRYGIHFFYYYCNPQNLLLIFTISIYLRNPLVFVKNKKKLVEGDTTFIPTLLSKCIPPELIGIDFRL